MSLSEQDDERPLSRSSKRRVLKQPGETRETAVPNTKGNLIERFVPACER